MSLFPATEKLPQAGNVSARYLMDEASGNAIDEVGSLDLTDNGSVGAGTGLFLPGGNFDNSRDFEVGSAQFFSHVDNTAFDLTGDFTLSVWFNPESFGANSSFITKWGTSGNRSFLTRVRTDAKVDMEISGNGTSGDQQSVLIPGTISSGTFTHLTFVFEASTRLTIYINGSNVAENTTSIKAGVFNSNSPFQIGNDNLTRYADGLMQDAIIWKGAALADSEAIALFNLYQTAPVIGGHTYFM